MNVIFCSHLFAPLMLHSLHFLLLSSSKISSTQCFSPAFLFLLFLSQLSQLILVQRSCVAPLRPIDALFAREIAHATQDPTAGECAADAFSDAALNGVDVLIACHIG